MVRGAFAENHPSNRANVSGIRGFVGGVLRDYLPSFHARDYSAVALGPLICFLLLPGCAVSVGPQTKFETVVLRPGTPLRVTKNATVEGKPMNVPGTEKMPAHKQDVGGWVMMPPEHFTTMNETIVRLAKENSELRGDAKK